MRLRRILLEFPFRKSNKIRISCQVIQKMFRETTAVCGKAFYYFGDHFNCSDIISPYQKRPKEHFTYTLCTQNMRRKISTSQNASIDKVSKKLFFDK